MALPFSSVVALHVSLPIVTLTGEFAIASFSNPVNVNVNFPVFGVIYAEDALMATGYLSK